MKPNRPIYNLWQKKWSPSLLSTENYCMFADKLFTHPAITSLWQETVDATIDEEKKAAFTIALYGSYQYMETWLYSDQRIRSDQMAQMILKLSRKICI